MPTFWIIVLTALITSTATVIIMSMLTLSGRISDQERRRDIGQ